MTPNFTQWRESIICRQIVKNCKHGQLCYPNSGDRACVACYEADMRQRQHNIAENGHPEEETK